MKKSFLIALPVIALLFTGCGSNGTYEETAMENNSLSSSYTDSSMISFSESSSEETQDGSSEADIVKQTQMIIRDADVEVDVGNLEEFNISINSLVDEYGGYFEKSEIQDYSSDYSTYRYAYYTIRIPNEKLDDFLSNVDGEGNITSKSITSDDVSLEYVDNEAKISSLESELKVLEDMKLKTETVSDLIEIQEQISNIQYQLDSAKGQKRYLEGRVRYSTVNLSAREERNVDNPIGKAFQINFTEELLSGMQTAVTVFVGLITAIPVITIITTFIILFIWVLKKVCSKVFKPKNGIRFKYMLVPIDTQENVINKSTGSKPIHAENTSSVVKNPEPVNGSVSSTEQVSQDSEKSN
ncbi:MAG: DUF4349 domain-containing protein [Butyrivibrio sp.]|nr:DUF4349 domain-containing protein [Butyrivibrio sp.]